MRSRWRTDIAHWMITAVDLNLIVCSCSCYSSSSSLFSPVCISHHIHNHRSKLKSLTKCTLSFRLYLRDSTPLTRLEKWKCSGQRAKGKLPVESLSSLVSLAIIVYPICLRIKKKKKKKYKYIVNLKPFSFFIPWAPPKVISTSQVKATSSLMYYDR